MSIGNYFWTRVRGPIPKLGRILTRCPVEDGGCGKIATKWSPTPNAVLRCDVCGTRLKAD